MIRKFIEKVLGKAGGTEEKQPPAAEKAPAAAEPGDLKTQRPARREGRKRRKGRGGKSAEGAGGSGAPKPTAGQGTAEGQAPEREKRRRRRDRQGQRGRPENRRGRRSAEGQGRAAAAPEAPAEPLGELPPMPPWSPPEDPRYFGNYDFPEEVRRGIEDAGFEKCTEVQAKVLPLAMAGRDVAAQSQTGTGKTAAFLITIFAHLLRRGPVRHRGPRALILAPTRELTVQIEKDARLLGGATDLSVGVAFGGVDYDRQRRALETGVDVLVGTPGRLIDYLKQGVWSPSGVEVLVIDEADRMLDMGFIRDLRFILRRLPHYERRLSMLFSATLSWRAMELTYEYMNLPEQISASPQKVTAERAEEVLYHVERAEKAALLLGLMKKEQWERTMVFTNMKVEAEKVGRLLQQHGLRAMAITGNLEQKKRLALMDDFKKGQLPILVATDVASRGLHIEGVTHVVNWDLPQDPEDYVHRIGRTARAGASGKAISLADEEGAFNLENIEKLIGYKIPVSWHTEEDLAQVSSGWERRPREWTPQGQRRSGDRGRGRSGRGRSGGGRRSR